MANKMETYYPPYTGREPYIHLCFSDRDERRIRPLLRRLLLRGCRVWYCTGETADRDEQISRNRRMLGAGLTVLYLTESVRRDTELKNRLLVCQKNRQSILVLDTDGGDRSLSVGLTGAGFTTVLGGNAPDACDAILHGQGFCQAYLGDPLPVFDRLRLRRISALLILLSLLLAAGVGVYKYLNPPEAPPIEEPMESEPEPTPEPKDEVLIEDETLREAVRAAIGGGQITREALSRIETLSLSQLPKNEEDLAAFPNLTTLILSQEAARTAPEMPALYDSYELIVSGGEDR